MTTTPPDRPPGSVDPKLLEILVCPLTKSTLEYDVEKQELISRAAKLAYPIRDGIPIMLPEEARRLEWFTVIARRAQHAEAISAASTGNASRSSPWARRRRDPGLAMTPKG